MLVTMCIFIRIPYDDIDQALKEDASLQSVLVELEKEKKEIE